ncbi:hypothetical protein IAG41_03190 [Sphingomonas sp. JC676]|uniref:hypothetical protein n=1 Tax=Sphingomonas sp. JC676 TaxID=2768065 RepID=UPI001657DCC8|nr:hypothetical protein [Sphingomonas sp. JC676]MBC9031388.1 hypothetical protein [Sphingomonas sp. JC676]
MQTASKFFSADPRSVTARDEARFFGGLRTGNFTFKRTGEGRLRVMDRALIEWLDRATARIDTVLDLGISSGVTTAELAEAIAQSGRSVRMTGTDRGLAARIVDLPMGCRALVEPTGHVLQYEILGRAMRPWTRRLDYLTGMAVAQKVVNRTLGPLARALGASPHTGDPVALVSRRLAQSDAMRLIEDDVTIRNPALTGGFDLIRAANILNRHYFEPAELQRAVDNVRSYLRGPGAWLLVLRTHGDAEHRGTLFRMADDGALDVVERWGGGSEIEEMFLRMPVLQSG